MKIQNGDYVSESCGGRYATVTFSNTATTLNVYDGNGGVTRAPLYDFNDPQEELDLDRSYYIIK